MKRLPIYTAILLLSINLVAQDDFNDQWNAAYELAVDDQYDAALAAFEPLLKDQPSYARTHVQMAWCYMMNGEIEEAGERAQTAYQLDPLSAATYAINSYLLYVSGNNSAGDVFLNDAIWFTPDDESLPSFMDDVNKMKAAGLEFGALETDLQTALDGVETRNRKWGPIQDKFFEAVGILGEGDNVKAKATFKEIFPMFEEVPAAQQRFAFNVSYVAGTQFYAADDTANYVSLFTRTYDYMAENSKTSYYLLMQMSTLLGEHYHTYGEYEKSFEYISKGLTHYPYINAYRFLGTGKAQFLYQYAVSALAVGNMQEGRDAGKMITELTYTGYDEWYQVNGLIFMAQSWNEDDTKAQEYYQQAYDLAESNGFEDLKNSIAANLK